MGWLSQKLGQQKEQSAETWLKQQNCLILAKNFKCKGGEIDLIGLESASKTSVPAEKTLVFFEVKYRKNNHFGSPEEAISTDKQARIALCAKHFLNRHPDYQNYAMRFDSLAFENNQSEPRWLKDAFWLE